MSECDYDNLKLENQLCFPLYALSREVIKRYRPYLAELNLTYTQYIAMIVFWEHKKINVKELGRKLYLDSGTLTPVLKCLESKGFVSRYRSAEDERVLMVEVTETGMELREHAASITKKLRSCVDISNEDRAMMKKQLCGLLNQLEK